MSDVNKILYVEDEADIRTIAEIALRDIGGFTLNSCSSGAQALESVAEFNPDLILLDVMMPGMGGPETLEELRKLNATASTPVIFMTAKVQPQEIEYYKSLGAVDVISKPFNPLTLAVEIKKIMSQI